MLPPGLQAPLMYCSVVFLNADPSRPPKANAAVNVPADPIPNLAVIMLEGAEPHTSPTYCSVETMPVVEGPLPPKDNAAS